MLRYQEHLNGNGSAWTRKYKPIGIEKVIENASAFDEDKTVKEYMSKHGIENVRGGSYVSDVLPEFQVKAIKTELRGSTDSCFRCGRPGHWANDCFARTEINPKKTNSRSLTKSSMNRREADSEDEESDSEDEESDSEDEESDSEDEYNFKEEQGFDRCGRDGHYTNNCYPRTDVDDNEEDDSFDENEDNDYY